MAELNKSRNRKKVAGSHKSTNNKKRKNSSAANRNKNFSPASEKSPNRKTVSNQTNTKYPIKRKTRTGTAHYGKRKRRKNKSNYIIYYVFSIISALIIVIILSVTILFPIERVMVIGDFSGGGENYKSDGLPIKTEENGKYQYTEEEIISVAAIEKGKNLIKLNSKEVEDRLIKNLYALDKVKVIKQLPNIIKIQAFTARSRALVVQSGKFYAVSSAGRIIEETDNSSGMIKIYGLEIGEISPGDYLKTDNEKQIAAMNIILSEIETLNFGGVESIDVTDYLNITVNWEDKINIIVGTSGEIKLKLSVAKELLESYIEYNARGRLWVNDPETPRFRPESADTYIPVSAIIGNNSSGNILDEENNEVDVNDM